MANDKIHDAVVAALKNDDWHILHQNFSIRYAEVEIRADVIAEPPPILAEKDDRQILVEIKTFGGRSFIKEMQHALGQYIYYRNILTFKQETYEMFMAIDKSVYEMLFQQQATSQIVKINKINLLIVDVPRKEVVKWIKHEEQ
ncbi:MAG: element excision factor XisH family protein [Chloroflexota bacterium]